MGNRLVNKLPIPENQHLDYVDKRKSPISSFFFQLVLPKELQSEILLLRKDKSYGLYSSPTKLLKCSRAVIAPVLTDILHQEKIRGQRGDISILLKLYRSCICFAPPRLAFQLFAGQTIQLLYLKANKDVAVCRPTHNSRYAG